MSITLYITAVYGKNRLHVKRQRVLKLLERAGPLKLVGMDCLGSLLNTEQENHFVIVFCERYIKLTKEYCRLRLKQRQMLRYV